jgi:hypothetical protein
MKLCERLALFLTLAITGTAAALWSHGRDGSKHPVGRYQLSNVEYSTFFIGLEPAGESGPLKDKHLVLLDTATGLTWEFNSLFVAKPAPATNRQRWIPLGHTNEFTGNAGRVP